MCQSCNLSILSQGVPMPGDGHSSGLLEGAEGTRGIRGCRTLCLCEGWSRPCCPACTEGTRALWWPEDHVSCRVPMKAGHRALPSPFALWSSSPKTKEEGQFPLMLCHPTGQLSSPKSPRSKSQLQSQLCRASCWDHGLGFSPFLRAGNLPLATWHACLWICSFSCSLAHK